jgi:hypothetical protein
MNVIPEMPNLKIPPELIRQLKDSEANLSLMRKQIDVLKALGGNTQELEDVYNNVSRMRDVILKAFG